MVAIYGNNVVSKANQKSFTLEVEGSEVQDYVDMFLDEGYFDITISCLDDGSRFKIKAELDEQFKDDE